MLVKDILRKKSKAGDVGIEVEVEAGAVLPVDVPKPWAHKGDNSLRGSAGRESAAEYYTQGPIPVTASKFEKIKRLTDALDVKKYKIDVDSPRTSVHVHVNLLDFRPTEVWTSIVGYWLFEDVFMNYCGKERLGCMYCLRLRDAEGVAKSAVENVKAAIPFLGLGNDDHIRYCGQNLKAIGEFGTLEYRGMRGTLDPEVIDNWSTMMYECVYNSPLNWESPAALMDHYWMQGAEATLGKLTTQKNYDILTAGCPEWQDLSEENATNLFELAYGVDWKIWEKAREANWEKSKTDKDKVNQLIARNMVDNFLELQIEDDF